MGDIADPSPDVPAENGAKLGQRGKIAVVGAGPAGICIALLLARQDYTVHVFDKRPAPEKGAPLIDQRTIIFGVNARGKRALTAAGVQLPDESTGVQSVHGMRRASSFQRHWTLKNGKTKSDKPMPVVGSAFFTERSALVEHMFFEAQRLEPDRVVFKLGVAISDVNIHKRCLTYSQQDKGSVTEQYDLIIGSDGSNSIVRQAMQANDETMTTQLVPADRSYVSFVGLPPLEGWTLMDDKGTTVKFMLSPSLTSSLVLWRSLSGTISGLFSAKHETKLFQQGYKAKDWEDLVRRLHPLVPEAWVPEIGSQLEGTQPSLMGATLKCSTITAPGVVLLGDAAHSVRPTMGQGANSALETALVLAEAIKLNHHNLEAALEQFEADRLPDIHALFDLDISAIPRVGSGPYGMWDPRFLVNKFHLSFWGGLHKALPGLVARPELEQMAANALPFRQALWSLKRDGVLLTALVAGVAYITVSQLHAHGGHLSQSITQTCQKLLPRSSATA